MQKNRAENREALFSAGTWNSAHALDAITNKSVGLTEDDLTAPVQRLFAVPTLSNGFN